jgi:hypothetical protein
VGHLAAVRVAVGAGGGDVARRGEAAVKFYVGLHQPSDARHFARCMVSVKRLERRVSDFQVGEWMMDSGAFTELRDHGCYRASPEDYAGQVVRWSRVGNMVAAVSQDFMCEPFILERTGLTVADHQRLTIERYDAIRELAGSATYVLPVLQGYRPSEYLDHLRQYGDRLAAGQWVGVGSVCKRNADLREVERVLVTIHRARPDLLLHGFGMKVTALRSSLVRGCLHSADSMAWSFAARREGRDQNDWREAAAYAARVERQEVAVRHFQARLFE